MKELLIQFLIICVSSFVLTAILTYFIIPILKGKKVKQHILEVGPRWHSKKEGTPTMGGIGFIISILVSLLGISVWFIANQRQAELIPLALTLMLAVLIGMIGFFDDFCKLMKKQNQGLKAYQKSALQLIVAILYIFVMKKCGFIDTTLHIPFADIHVELGIVYYLFAVLTIVGIVNSVNLTDGIDGLASTVTLIVSLFFGFVAFSVLNESLILISAALIGGMVGFLIFNLHPAKVFMGDTGSLFLGGIVTGAAFLIGNPLIIVVAGGIFVLEALSDIIQVGVFKLSGRKKRLFKMAPIHHHFEKCGWSEIKIVAVFSFVTVVFCALAWFSI
jgi:phospho-N-acetylmuramoyl-pentapeptide-transferase